MTAPSETGHAVLSVEALELRFGAVVALAGVDVSIRPGEWIGVIGPNGSGKSSLLNCIAGHYIPSSGSIVYGRHDVAGLTPGSKHRRGITRTFQNLLLADDLTLQDNVLIGCEASPSERRRISRDGIKTVMDDWGLSENKHDYPPEVPYGIRKLAEVARAVVSSPRLLLLDEPVAGLAPEERSEVAARLIRLRSDSPELAVLLVEHDTSFVSQLCTTTVALGSGRVLATGHTNDVLRDREVVAAYIGGEV